MRGPSGLPAHSPKFNLPSPQRALRDLATPFDELGCPCDNIQLRLPLVAFGGDLWPRSPVPVSIPGVEASQPQAAGHIPSAIWICSLGM